MEGFAVTRIWGECQAGFLTTIFCRRGWEVADLTLVLQHKPGDLCTNNTAQPLIRDPLCGMRGAAERGNAKKDASRLARCPRILDAD